MQKKHPTIISFITLIIMLFVFGSCDSRQKEEEQADVRLKHIEKLINENALNVAKIEIDSVHFLFPRLVAKRRIAQAFEDTIVRRESARTLAYCDSILVLKQREVESIQRNFRFEKDKVYQDLGNFVYKTQLTENNTNRNYLKAFVDENAEFYLISNYCGGKLEHTSVRVSANNLSTQTDTIDISDASNHSFTDAGTRWEAVTFKNKTDNGVTAFISQNGNKRIKVSLIGNRTHDYYLADSDKRAISETYHLWVAKRDVAKLQKEIKTATNKIERIKQFYKIPYTTIQK